MKLFNIFSQGFALQASLILALGAQNIFVLNSGLLKQRHLLVALVSSVCDAILIMIGVWGLAQLLVQIPILQLGVGAIGVLFLAFYGYLKLRDASQNSASLSISPPAGSIWKTILTTLGFSLLNPHVYLDTVFLVGGYSSRFSETADRIYFGLGAATFSTLWFFGLALLAAWGSQLLNNSKSMRTISFISGIVLIALSIRLAIDLVNGLP